MPSTFLRDIWVGGWERLVNRRGDGMMKTADMAMTQMMYVEESKEAQTEKVPKQGSQRGSQKGKRADKRADKQADKQADKPIGRQAKSVGRGSKGQMQPCERNRWLVESASPGFPLRGSTHRRCGFSLSQPLAGEEDQSRWVGCSKAVVADGQRDG